MEQEIRESVFLFRGDKRGPLVIDSILDLFETGLPEQDAKIQSINGSAKPQEKFTASM